MKYVYLVYDDWHGLLCICATPEKATEQVKDEAFGADYPRTHLSTMRAQSVGVGKVLLGG